MAGKIIGKFGEKNWDARDVDVLAGFVQKKPMEKSVFIEKVVYNHPLQILRFKSAPSDKQFKKILEDIKRQYEIGPEDKVSMSINIEIEKYQI